MMNSIYLNGYRNGIKIQFLNSVITIAGEYDMEMLHIKNEMDALMASYAEAEESYKADAGSNKTDDVVFEDKRRDLAERTIRNVAKAYHLHFNKEKSGAGDDIVETIDKYGKQVYNLNIVEETSVLDALVAEFENEYLAPKITLLGLNDLVAELKDSNNKCKAHWLERSKESSEENGEATGTLLKKAIADYQKLEDKIRAVELVMPSENLTTLVARLNDVINRYLKM